MLLPPPDTAGAAVTLPLLACLVTPAFLVRLVLALDVERGQGAAVLLLLPRWHFPLLAGILFVVCIMGEAAVGAMAVAVVTFSCFLVVAVVVVVE